MGQDPHTRPPVEPTPGSTRQPPAGSTRRPGEDARTSTLVRALLLLVVAGMLCLNLAFPWRLAGIGFTVAALVVGVLALTSADRSRAARSRIVVIALGLVLAGLLLLAHLLLAAFYSQVRGYERCLAGANTERAQVTCERSIRDGLLSLDAAPQSRVP